jgi:hypothetical protein
VARSPLDAFALVARSPPGTLAGIVPQPIEHRPGGRVQVVAMAPDRIELDVESEGGVAVIRRAFQPLLRARIEGREIATVPVNLCQLGLLVPAGKHRVVVAVSSWPEIVAGVIATAVALTLLWIAIGIGARGRGRRVSAKGSPRRAESAVRNDA